MKILDLDMDYFMDSIATNIPENEKGSTICNHSICRRCKV